MVLYGKRSHDTASLFMGLYSKRSRDTASLFMVVYSNRSRDTGSFSWLYTVKDLMIQPLC